MEDISSGSLWNYLSGTPNGSTETSGLQSDRKTTPMPGFRVQEKPHRECKAWKSGRAFTSPSAAKLSTAARKKRKI